MNMALIFVVCSPDSSPVAQAFAQVCAGTLSQTKLGISWLSAAAKSPLLLTGGIGFLVGFYLFQAGDVIAYRCRLLRIRSRLAATP